VVLAANRESLDYEFSAGLPATRDEHRRRATGWTLNQSEPFGTSRSVVALTDAVLAVRCGLDDRAAGDLGSQLELASKHRQSADSADSANWDASGG
jgi:hypothetical protein